MSSNQAKEMADQKKVEAGREMLAAYRKKKKSPSKKGRASKTPEKVPRSSGDSPRSIDSTAGTSDSETSGTTILNEPFNSSDKEGGDIQRLSTRIKELEEIVAGKDAALAAQREELDMTKDFSVDVSTGMLSFGLESEYKACLEKYQQRLVEFESAVNHRDDLIRQLSEGVRLAKLSHESREEQLAQGIELLQRQLHAATELVEGHSWDTGVNPHEYLQLKNQMLALEDTVQRNATVINELNTTIRQKDETLQTKAEELSALKTKASVEVQELMREIEELNQRSQTTISNITLDETLLRAQIEEGFGLQLTQIKVELRNQLALEYTAEVSSLKQQVELLASNARSAAAVEDRLTTELASYEVELTLHKEQTETLKQKLTQLASEMEASQLSHQSELMSYKQQVATLTDSLKNVTVLVAEVDSLKRTISVLKDTHARDLDQCRQNHIKEVDMLNRQNETLEMELDKLQTEEGKCAAELNACKEAFVAQFGIPKVTNAAEVVTLRQQVQELTAQLTDATAVREKFSTELDSRRDALERERRDLHEVKVNSLSETIEQLLTSQEELVNENALCASQMNMYKDWLREKSAMEESHGQDVKELQKEFSNYKQQVENIEESHSNTISSLNKAHEERMQQLSAQLEHVSSVSTAEIHLLNEQIQTLKSSLEETAIVNEKALQELDLSRCDHKAQAISYENKLREMNLHLDELTRRHGETVSAVRAELDAANASLLEKSRLVDSCQNELRVCKDQLAHLNATHGVELQDAMETYGRGMQAALDKYGKDLLVERDQITDIHNADLAEIHRQIHDLTKRLSKESRFDPLSTESDSPLAAAEIKKEISGLQFMIKCREENFGTVKSQLLETMAVLQGTQALLAGKEELEQSLHERELMLNQANESFTTLKEAESALESRVNELEGELDRRANECLALKEKIRELSTVESQAVLQTTNRIQELEGELDRRANECLALKEKIRELSTVESQAVLQTTNRIQELEGELDRRSKECLALKGKIQELSTVEPQVVLQTTNRMQELDQQPRECLVVQEKIQQLSAVKWQVDRQTEPDRRISELEATVRQTNSDLESLRDTLQETVAQLLTAQTLVDAKEEIETSLQNRITELMSSLQAVNIDSQAMRAESERLALQVAKAKELLKRLKAERDNLMALNKEHDDEINVLKEKLSVSDSSLQDSVVQVEKLRELLASKSEGASQTKSDNSEFLTVISRLQNVHEDLVSKCDRYEEEMRLLQGQLASSEDRLEAARQELSNNRSSQDVVSGPMDLDRRETILASGGQAAVAGLSFLGNTFYNENNNSGFLNNMSEYMHVASFKASNGMNWIENCNQLENERNELERTVESLRDKLKEKELSEELCKQEIATSLLRHKDLENRLAEMTNNLEKVEINIAEKIELENKVTVMERELKTLKDIQASLQNELLNKQVTYEEKLHKIVEEQLSESMPTARSANIEEVIRELGGKAKEVIVLAEKLRGKEQTEAAMSARLAVLQECEGRYANQLAALKEEASRARLEVLDSWQSHRQTQDELAQARRELALLRLMNEQLEGSQARLREASSGSLFVSAKLAALKEILDQQASRGLVAPVDQSRASCAPVDQSRASCGSADASLDVSVGDLRCKLEGIFKRDTERVRPADHAADLAFYREQHAALAEVLGSVGAGHELQDVSVQLSAERSTTDQLRLQLSLAEQWAAQLATQLFEAQRQSAQLEEQLAALRQAQARREGEEEERRGEREREDKERDLRIRQWQAQCREKEVELSHSQTLSQLSCPSPPSPRGEERLDRVRLDLDQAHDRAVDLLKQHLQEVFALQETETRAENARGLADLEQRHLEQLANTQQQIQAKIQELDTFQRVVDQREKHESDLEEIKLKLDDSQKEIYSVLRQQFESFAQRQIEAAMEKLQTQHEIILASQTDVHLQELQALRAKLELQKEKEILCIKQELLQRHERDLKEVRNASETERAGMKNTPRSYPTNSKSAVKLLKQLLCNEFTSSFRALTNARYGNYRKQLSELTLQLEAALKQGDPLVLDDVEELVGSQETLVEQAQALLQTAVLEHSRMLEALGEHLDVGHTQLLNYLEHTAQDVEAAVAAATLRGRVATLQQEAEQHRSTADQLSRERDDAVGRLEHLTEAAAGAECGPCAVLRQEMEGKHAKEVEELRQYFEQKCADVEKHYSEEVFSQHSRKLSTGSSSCDNELVSDQLCYGSGDHARATAHVCDTLDPTYKDLEDQCRRDYEKRTAEYREQLETVKRDAEEKYRLEVDALREDYEARVEELVRDLTSSHQVDVEEMEEKHRKEVENVKREEEEKHRKEVENVKREEEEKHRKEVENVKREEEEKHRKEVENVQKKHLKEVENIREKMRSEAEAERDELEAVHARQLGNLKIVFEQKLSADIETLTDRMLSEEADHIERVRAELIECHAEEVAHLQAQLAAPGEQVAQLQALLAQGGEGRFGEEYRERLEELEARHGKEMECQRKVLAEQMEQLTELIKLGAEQEQDKFMKVQKEIMSGFLLQHKQDLKLLTEQHEAQLNMAQEEIRKLLAERAEYDEMIVQGKRRLHAEVLQDVVTALDQQLQALLNDSGDSLSCPPELLQLYDRFAARYKLELVALKDELTQLRRTSQVSATRDSIVYDSCQATTENNQHHNNDRTRQLAKTIKSLVSEITKYVSVCEDELNNTLVHQLLLYEEASESRVDDREPSLFRDAADTSLASGDIPYLSIMSNLDNSDLASKSLSNDNTLSKSLSNHNTLNRSLSNDDAMNKSEPDENAVNKTPVTRKGNGVLPVTPGRRTRRVHFAPDISSMADMDEEGLMAYVGRNSEGATSAIRAELDQCLERLRADARALIRASAAVPKQVSADEQHAELLGQLAAEREAREQLSARLEECRAYKSECERLAGLIERLGSELCAARMRISELESREDVAEGYGEQGRSALADRVRNLADLQDQARGVLNEGRVSAPHGHLIEELCREGDRLVEEAKHEKEDLQLQVSLETPSSIVHRVCCEKVDAADKQLRCTRLFLEEQAAEREQERDDFLQEISRLSAQLKVNEGLKVDGRQLAKEVETLEVQVKEATSLLKEAETRKEELEAELKAAIDKVWVLRDIISELEAQAETRAGHEAAMEEQLRDLQEALAQQTQSNQDLTKQLDSEQSDMAEQIGQLEEELRLHRQQMEQLQPDSDALKQMFSTLREFETTLDSKTRELESVYVTTSSSSSSPSASEEVSIREHIDQMRSSSPDSSLLPLTQLLRLQDKMAVHSRAEQAALKKIRDLEMQCKALKYDEEEVAAERDVLQTQVEQQLLKISLLHKNIEDQRSRADDVIQVASADLHKRLHDREIETRDLKKALENKEKQVKAVQVLLEQTRQAVAAQEAEWTGRMLKEQQEVQTIKKEYRRLREEKSKERNVEAADQSGDAGSSFGRYVPIPSLLDAVQANCNAEISQLQGQLEAYRSLKLTPEQRAMLEQLLKRLKASRPDCDPETCEDLSTTLLFEHGSEASRDNIEDFYDSEAESDMDDSDLRKQLLRRESTIASLRHKLADQMQGSLSALKLEMKNKAERIDQLENQLSELPRLQAEIKQLREQLGNTSSDSTRDNSRGGGASESKLLADINSLEEDLKQERQLTKSLKDELNQLRAELDGAKLAGGSENACSAPCALALRSETPPSMGLSPSITAILHKILDDGFEALSLEELTSVHEPLCFATGRMIAANPDLRPINTSLQAVDPYQLCGRIYRLEKEIVRKEQASPQKKVCSLESSADYERQRLHDLKAALAEHERSNRDLHSLLGDQQQVRGDLEAEREMLRDEALFHENKATAARQHLEREKMKNRRMEEELNKERNNTRQVKSMLEEELNKERKNNQQLKSVMEVELIKERKNNQQLKSVLEAERNRAIDSNTRESDLLEAMREQLEASRDAESRMRAQLEQLAMTQQLPPSETARRYDCMAPCNTSLSQPVREHHVMMAAEEDLVTRLQLELRREQRTVEQMQTLLDKEKLHSTQRLEKEREKNKKLRKQLSTTEDEKENVIIELDGVRGAVSSQQLVAENLERKLADWKGAEQRRHQRWAEEEDSNRKSLEKALCAKFELEQKIMDLEQEMLNVRDQAVSAGDSVTIVQLRQQLAEANKREQRLVEQLSASPRESKISTSLLRKLQVMNSILDTHVAEHTDIVNSLTLERQHLLDKVKALEARAMQAPEGCKSADNDTEIGSGAMSAERAAWAREKAALLGSLAQAEAVRRHHDNNNADADRVRHLFGKYLRVESYRKALVWQKRYLMVVISGYQEFENRTVSKLTHIARTQGAVKLTDAAPSASSGAAVNKFRSCGMAIIAVQRMKYLVKRWRHSQSVGGTAVLIHGSTESIASAQSSYFGSRRHVPSYWSVPRGMPSSASSPTREQHGSAGPASLDRDSHMLHRWQLEPQYRSTEAITGLEPVQVTEFINRFDQIQQRLGVSVAQPPS